MGGMGPRATERAKNGVNVVASGRGRKQGGNLSKASADAFIRARYDGHAGGVGDGMLSDIDQM